MSKQGGYGGYSRHDNPYAQQDTYNPYGGSQPGAYDDGYDRPNQGYDQPGVGADYEMSSMNNGADNYQAFFSEATELGEAIDTVKSNISRIETLHQRSLTDIDESASQQTQRQLEVLVTETSALNNNLATRIKSLKAKYGRDPNKGASVGNLDRNFKDTLRKYQLVEKNFADRTREQMARQYRIVRPDATEEEVQSAVEDQQGQQIFSQALLSGNRRGEARSALREVQARHNEIQRIEKTIVELAQLFNDMEQLVTEQEVMVENIDQRGEEVVTNLDKGTEELGGAVKSARSRRRKKWWCLLIVLLIIIVVIIIAVVVTLINKKK